MPLSPRHLTAGGKHALLCPGSILKSPWGLPKLGCTPDTFTNKGEQVEASCVGRMATRATAVTQLTTGQSLACFWLRLQSWWAASCGAYRHLEGGGQRCC